jgi:hypothetical protein
VTVTLLPEAEAVGTGSEPVQEWSVISDPKQMRDYAPPNFVVALNPFSVKVGDHRVLVDLDGDRIADLPFFLRVKGQG